jgi:RNA polymerase sigma factor (sigma-70 family)
VIQYPHIWGYLKPGYCHLVLSICLISTPGGIIIVERPKPMDKPLRYESIPQPMKLSQSRSDESFESTFHEYWNAIHRLLTRMVRDPSEAEDLALETFYRLYKYRPSQHEALNVRSWLYKVATNLGLQSIRGFKRREHYEVHAGKDALTEAQQDQPSRIFAEKEAQQFVRLALGQMNPRQAELLIMRYSGMAYKDIAAAMSLSPTSIGPLLLRAEREFEQIYRTLVQEEER